jgi:hypothetical protein
LASSSLREGVTGFFVNNLSGGTAPSSAWARSPEGLERPCGRVEARALWANRLLHRGQQVCHGLKPLLPAVLHDHPRKSAAAPLLAVFA